MPGCEVLYYDPAQVGQVRRAAGQALGPVSDGWRPCSAPGQVWTDPGQVLRFVCHTHRRQLTALWAAGLADRIRWARAGLALATPPIASKEAPVREHVTSVHLMLDPADPSKLHVEARRHPELLDIFYVSVDSERCHITLSGQPELLVAVVERMRAELTATLTAAGHPDPTQPAQAEPATEAVA